ncbi:MAG: 50S ribosomal protein L44e [Nanoarchaeota archaeon]
MNIPKQKNMYCPFCKKHTLHKISTVKGKERGSLKWGSIKRAMKRGRGVGYGNLGKWGSKPAISKWKRTGAKVSKKTNLKFTCDVCKKAHIQNKGIRSKKIEIK